MAKLCLVLKQKKKPKFAVRGYNRCTRCGRVRGYMRRFQMCRICVRECVSKGLVPGVVKASW
jgi:small subunit ribosomal protein S14